jgi:hypothetical protein
MPFCPFHGRYTCHYVAIPCYFVKLLPYKVEICIVILGFENRSPLGIVNGKTKKPRITTTKCQEIRVLF